jgi:hypothetical protein
MFAIALILAEPPSAPATSPLEGAWKTACVPMWPNVRQGMIVTVTFTGETIDITSQVYAHDSCDTPTILIEMHGTILRTDPADGGVTFDYAAETFEMTLEAPDVVDTYNKPNSGCGLGGGWVLGQRRNVAGWNCPPIRFPVTGTRFYDRAWITGDTLRVGITAAALVNITPDKRPAVPGSPTFTRVEPGK